MSTFIASMLALAAFATSAFSAIVGMGGGVTLLGAMAIVLPAGLVVPIHGIAQLCSNLTRTIVFIPHVRWRFFFAYVPGLVVGVALATLAWQGVKLTWFKPFIGIFLLLFLFSRGRLGALRAPPLWIYAPLGLVAGFLSLFVGATGPFIAPFFLREDFDKEQVVATKAVCQSLTHLLKIPAFVALGFDYLEHAPILTLLVAMVIIGTVAGKRVLQRLDESSFERLFVVVLSLLALNLIAGHFL
jgi:uncharacterized membrane protein YfcA